MTDELKTEAEPCIDYFDDELRVDDSSADGSKVFHVGKQYTKGADYHEQRKEFWLDLARREAMVGNSGVIESALGWAEKHAKLAAPCAAMPSAIIITKAAADEIRTLMTTGNKTDFNRKKLKCMIDQAKTHAHLGDRSDVERILSDAKKFAESVGLYNDDLELELKDIPSLVNEEKELEIAIRGTSLSFEHAAAAARMGFVDVMENKLSYAEKDAALASIDIEEKVRNLIATLTPEQQKEFKKIADEKAKAVADDNKTVDNKSTVTENDNVTTDNVKPEAKVTDNSTTTAVDGKNDAKVAGDDRVEVADDTTTVENTTDEDDGIGNADDKPKVDDNDDTASVNNRTESHGNHRLEETGASNVEQRKGADHKPEMTKADDDNLEVAGNKPKTEKIGANDEKNGVNKNIEAKLTDSGEMVVGDNIGTSDHDEMIVAGDEQDAKMTDAAESGITAVIDDNATVRDGKKVDDEVTAVMDDKTEMNMTLTSDKPDASVAKNGDTTATSGRTKTGKRAYAEIAF